jgi:hypothetical protein
VKNLRVLWIVEKPSVKDSLAPILMGNYAVRVIASPSRLIQLLTLRQSYFPSLVLLNGDLIEEDAQELKSKLSALNIECMELISRKMSTPLNLESWKDETDLLTKISDRLSSDKSVGLYTRKFKDIMFCPKNQEVITLSGSRSLAKKESRILEVLLVNVGRCISREELACSVWQGTKVGPRTIDCHVSRLRKQLEDTEVEIQSSYGGGYKLA